MHRFRLNVAALCVALLPPLGSSAQSPSVALSPAPPGTIVQSRTVYLTGEAMNSRWRGVLSKAKIGTGDRGEVFYQWHLSIYGPCATEGQPALCLRYRSPRDGGPLTGVVKAKGANLWFPLQTAKIVGVADFEASGLERLVTQSHEFAADCGASTITVFGADPRTGKVRVVASVTNPCDLNAKIAHAANGDAIALRGPYYSATAAMCCPTKPKAAATLRFAGGRWIEAPKLFALKT